MWHYDQKYKQCNSFEYGGCLGNANRFKGREECEQTCVQTDSLSVSTNDIINCETMSDGIRLDNGAGVRKEHLTVLGGFQRPFYGIFQ